MKLKTQKNVDYRKLKITGGNNVDYDFSDYKTFKELFRDLYYRKTTIDEAKRIQEEFDVIINALKNYAPRDNEYVEAKNKLLNKVKNFYEGFLKLLKGLKMKYFHFVMMKIMMNQWSLKNKNKTKKKKNKKKKQQLM